MNSKRLVCCLTSITVLFSMMCCFLFKITDTITASAMSNSEITDKLTSLQSTYPSGSFWLTTSTQKYGGYQCYAFARQLAVDVFGTYPAKNVAYATEGEVSNGWTAKRNASNIKLEPGDIVRFDLGGGYGHSAMIWKIVGDEAFVGQCWGGSNNKVNWGHFWGDYEVKTISGLLNDSTFAGVWKHPDSGNTIDIPNKACQIGTIVV